MQWSQSPRISCKENRSRHTSSMGQGLSFNLSCFVLTFACMSSADFVFKVNFSRIPLKSLDPDQVRYFVEPYLGPNFLQK